MAGRRSTPVEFDVDRTEGNLAIEPPSPEGDAVEHL
jgi:hypothetical protein